MVLQLCFLTLLSDSKLTHAPLWYPHSPTFSRSKRTWMLNSQCTSFVIFSPLIEKCYTLSVVSVFSLQYLTWVFFKLLYQNREENSTVVTHNPNTIAHRGDAVWWIKQSAVTHDAHFYSQHSTSVGSSYISGCCVVWEKNLIICPPKRKKCIRKSIVHTLWPAEKFKLQ